MSEFLPPDVRNALAAAQLSKRRKASKLRVRSGTQDIPVLRMWDGGFSVELTQATGLSGLVDLYEGQRHLSVCLIVASEDAGDERRYEYKRATQARDQAPLDFERTTPAPMGYLPSPDVFS